MSRINGSGMLTNYTSQIGKGKCRLKKSAPSAVAPERPSMPQRRRYGVRGPRDGRRYGVRQAIRGQPLLFTADGMNELTFYIQDGSNASDSI